jgi:hypothetical protein
VYWRNVPIGIMFFCSLAFGFGCGEFYEGGPRVNVPLNKWSAIVEILRNAVFTWRGVNIWELRSAHHTYTGVTWQSVLRIVFALFGILGLLRDYRCRNAWRWSVSIVSQFVFRFIFTTLGNFFKRRRDTCRNAWRRVARIVSCYLEANVCNICKLLASGWWASFCRRVTCEHEVHECHVL